MHMIDEGISTTLQLARPTCSNPCCCIFVTNSTCHAVQRRLLLACKRVISSCHRFECACGAMAALASTPMHYECNLAPVPYMCAKWVCDGAIRGVQRLCQAHINVNNKLLTCQLCHAPLLLCLDACR